MIKKIDQLVIKSFVPPFLVAYSIAMFVLLMQMLWLYIDDIAGKGLSSGLILELLVYRSMSLVPIALTLGMLIASVMTMGNMAEKYELSSIKSAGVSLWRTMRAMVLFGTLVALFSAYCSNTLIPISNLKFGSRMFDIQKKEPTLQMEAGTFNYDFQGFAIHFKSKSKDGQTIKEVLVYDHSSDMSGQVLQIVAEKGEMFIVQDGQYFIMRLYNGFQYMDQRSRTGGSKGNYPFVRVGFEEWEKVFDLGDFALTRTNPELFNRNRQMMTTGQLLVAIDSIEVRVDKRIKELSNYFSGYFTYEGLDSTYIEISNEKDRYAPDLSEMDSDTLPQAINLSPDSIPTSVPSKINTEISGSAVQTAIKNKVVRSNRPSGGTAIIQKMDQPLNKWPNFMAGFSNEDQRKVYTKAKNSLRSMVNQSESGDRSVERMKISRVKHIYDMHMKYSMAAVCIIFVFIGAPMGAIIRKGGFGYPILVSIIFFIIFVIMMIFCRKFAEKFMITGEVAAWIPCAILLPVGIFLTYKAMQDSKLMNIEQIGKRFASLFSFLKKKSSTDASNTPNQS
jgi:lipopolysaccharide export system permease protein